MPTSEKTLAFLHAHGLDVEPAALAASLREAVQSLRRAYHAEPGREGLTGAEIEVARSGGLDPAPRARGRPALARGVVGIASLLETGLSTREAAKRLGVSEARIRQRLHQRTLLGIRAGRGWRLPGFQFLGKGELPGWSKVCRRIPPDVSALAVHRWLLLPHPDLVAGDDETPTSPLAWLADGRDPGRVVALVGDLT